jgi:ubiquinone/menaquinone biosynthesis C-methylase UbiE
MEITDATALIEGAVPRRPGTWVDLGAGDGTFTRALIGLIGRTSRIYAVDRDARALASLARWAKSTATDVVTVIADFSRPFNLPGYDDAGIDGVLVANSLHFVAEQETVLARLAAWLAPDGRVVFVEYDQRVASQWVPHPIPTERLPVLAAAAGLSPPIVTARRPSAFGGHLYAAVAERVTDDPTLGTSLQLRPR